jgi:hypothetical protein
MPTTMSVNTPEPPPRTTCEASQPDTSPTNNQTRMISDDMTPAMHTLSQMITWIDYQESGA